MKVLFVCADGGIPLDGVKGSSVHVRQTIDMLRSGGAEVTVLGFRPSAARLEDGRRATGAFREAASLRRGGDLAVEAIAGGETYDLVYERLSLWSIAGRLIAHSMGIPLIVEVNAPIVDEAKRHRGLVLESLARGIEKETLTAASAVLCVSRGLVARVREIRGGGDEVLWTPNCVDTSSFSVSTSRARRGRPVIVFTGSFRPWHGLDILIRAFAQVLSRRSGDSRPLLRLIGDGPGREAVLGLAVELGIASNVEAPGSVPHDRIPGLLRQADIAVSPAPRAADGGDDEFYFSPIKIAEYLACGLPVIGPEAGDLPAVLASGRDAWLVPPGDEPALAGALERLLDDDALRARMGAAGRRRFLETMSWEHSRGVLLEAYGVLCRKTNASAS
jgi:glycosyltransferase involved in cell wall biosynthesis